MINPFGAGYSYAYDSMYKDKDYQSECDMLEKIFARYEQGRVVSILDIGCGTGNHAYPLAERGYAVTGVDRSAHMLDQARAKSAGLSAEQGNPRFTEADMCTMDLGQTFDTALLMFNVVGYLLDDSQVTDTFNNIRRHLEPGNLFIADFWYGPAVLESAPEARTKTIGTDNGQIVRRAVPNIDRDNNICSIVLHVEISERGRPDEVSEERHDVRYFSSDEIGGYCGRSGFELLHIGNFPDFDNPPGKAGSWSAIAITRAV